MKEKINVAIVGLGFGAEFIPIYQNHPRTNMYAICQRSEDKLNQIGDHFNIEKRYTSFDDLIKDPEVDAVHINTPIQNHAEHSVKALLAGKHVACTVPMATSIDECWEIINAQKKSNMKYMMMETVVYSREFLYVKSMRDQGELGRIQFLRGSHQQEMAGWPSYWEGLPPMHYATHCVSPCLALADKPAEYISCFGSGRIDEHLVKKHNSPFAIETAHIKMKDSDLCAEVTRSLFNTAREYIESFDVYASKQSFEWTRVEHEKPFLHIGEKVERIDVPDFAHLLPDEIQQFTMQGVYDKDSNQHLSFIQGSGHGGSHPHMVNEFVNAVLENKDPYPNAVQAANWTSVGIIAHESAMQNGKILKVPDYK